MGRGEGEGRGGREKPETKVMGKIWTGGNWRNGQFAL